VSYFDPGDTKTLESHPLLDIPVVREASGKAVLEAKGQGRPYGWGKIVTFIIFFVGDVKSGREAVLKQSAGASTIDRDMI
jgi:hypothetical protein